MACSDDFAKMREQANASTAVGCDCPGENGSVEPANINAEWFKNNLQWFVLIISVIALLKS